MVSVVVVLGTEPVLTARSTGASAVSSGGAWVRMAGTELSKRMGWALSVGVMLLSQKGDQPGRATDWRVVVAGVNAGWRALKSAMGEPWGTELELERRGAGNWEATGS